MAVKDIVVKKYVVRLSALEREQLQALACKGKGPARLMLKARILLKADVSEGGQGGVTVRSLRLWTSARRCSTACANNWRKKGSRRC